jgi:surfactin synthase thioesterase subunit
MTKQERSHAAPGAIDDALLRRITLGCPVTRRVVYFAHAGAGASAARWLASGLPRDCELLAVLLPGREDRYTEPPFRSLYDAASAIATTLSELPYLRTTFFGHSFGAILAFETAHRLGASTGLCKLVVAGHDAPSIVRRPRNWHEFDDQVLIQTLRTLGGTHTTILEHDELMRLTLLAIRNDLKLLEEYGNHHTEPLTVDVTALASKADPETTRVGIDTWRDVTQGHFTSSWFPGGHFFPLLHVDAIARLLCEL